MLRVARSRAMPCYLFTYHAFGSWMPDHSRGYVHRGEGIRPPDERMAELYRGNLKQAVVRFDSAIQRELIAGVLEACQCQEVRCHFIATDSTHAHVLVSWNSDRSWEIVRKQIRSSITRRLNDCVRRQQWFSKSPSRKRVGDRKHFDYVVGVYLPKHSGWKWSEERGVFR
jgi:hypothetical protein